MIRIRTCKNRVNSRDSRGCKCQSRGLGKSHRFNLRSRSHALMDVQVKTYHRGYRCNLSYGRTIAYKVIESKEESG